jgi:hypothetical protein
VALMVAGLVVGVGGTKGTADPAARTAKIARVALGHCHELAAIVAVPSNLARTEVTRPPAMWFSVLRHARHGTTLPLG